MPVPDVTPEPNVTVTVTHRTVPSNRPVVEIVPDERVDGGWRWRWCDACQEWHRVEPAD